MLGAKLVKFWVRSEILGRDQIVGFGSEISCREQKFMLGAKFCAGSEISCREQNFVSGAKFHIGSEILGLGAKFHVGGEV